MPSIEGLTLRENMKIIITTLILSLGLSACAPVLVGGALVTAVNVAHDRRSSGQVLDDKMITASVKNELRKSLSDDSRIKVKTYNGVVLMAGEVKNQNDRVTAEDVAAVKDGVMKVVNELKLVDEVSMLGRRTKDKYISTKAKGSLLKVKLEDFDPTRVSIVTANHEVFLMGMVTQQEAEAVVDRIRNLKHVKRVVKIFEYMD